MKPIESPIDSLSLKKDIRWICRMRHIQLLAAIIMKNLIPVVYFSVILFSCTNSSDTKNESSGSIEDPNDSVSTVNTIHPDRKTDTIKVVDDTTVSIDLKEENISNTAFFERFLMEPINLSEFKNKYGPSNSGACCTGSPENLHEPPKDGFYYQYMFFWKLASMRYSDGSAMSEGDLFMSFQIYVYHFGNNHDFDFFNNDEILIGLSCAGSHPGLGQANLVAKSLSEIEKLFGNDYIDLDSIKIYQYNNRVLSLKFNSSKVESYKYFHLSSMVSKNKVPKALLIHPKKRE